MSHPDPHSTTPDSVHPLFFGRRQEYDHIHVKLLPIVIGEYFVGIVGTATNTVILLLIIIIPELRAVRGNNFIASLVVANILLCAKTLVYEALTPFAFPKDRECLLFAVLATFTVTASSFSRCAIAIDRYHFIINPLRYQSVVTERYVLIFLTSIWLIAGILAAVPLIEFQFPRHDDMICLPFLDTKLVILTMMAVITLSCVIIIYVYFKIYYWASLQIQIIKKEAMLALSLRPLQYERFSRKGLEGPRPTDQVLVPLSPDSINSCPPCDLNRLVRPGLSSASQIFGSTFRDSLSKMLDQLSKISNLSSMLSQPLSPSSAVDPDPNMSPTDCLEKLCVDKSASAQNVTSLHNADSFEVFDIYTTTSSFTNADLIARYGSAVDPPSQETASSSSSESSTESTESATLSSPDMKLQNLPYRDALHLTKKWLNQEFVRYSKAPSGSEQLSAYSENVKRKQNAFKLLNKSERKSLTVVFIIVGTFMTCWLPYLIFATMSLFRPGRMTGLQGAIIMLIGYTNSVLDPLIYSIINQPFRRAVMKYCGKYSRTHQVN